MPVKANQMTQRSTLVSFDVHQLEKGGRGSTGGSMVREILVSDYVP